MALNIFGNIVVDVADDAWFSRDVLREEAAKAAQRPPTIDPPKHLVWVEKGTRGQDLCSVEYLYSIDGARIYRKL